MSEAEREYAVAMSNRQFVMLRGFVAMGRYHFIPTEEAVKYNQTTFGSLIQREYVSWTKEGFYVTKDGYTAAARFENADILRHLERTTLSKWYTGHVIKSKGRSHAA